MLRRAFAILLLLGSSTYAQPPQGYGGGGGNPGTPNNSPGTLTFQAPVGNVTAVGSGESRWDTVDASIMFGGTQLANHEPPTPWGFMIGPNTWITRWYEGRARRTGTPVRAGDIGLGILQASVMGEYRAPLNSGTLNAQTVQSNAEFTMLQTGGGIIRKYYYICGRLFYPAQVAPALQGAYPGFQENKNPNAGASFPPFLTKLACGDFRLEWENLGNTDGRTLRIKWDTNNITWYEEANQLKVTNPDFFVIIDHYVQPGQVITMKGSDRATLAYECPNGGREVGGCVWAEWLPLNTPLPENGLGWSIAPNPGSPPGPTTPVQVAYKHYPDWSLPAYSTAPLDARSYRERITGVYYLPPNPPLPNPPFPTYPSMLINKHIGTLQ